MAEVELSGGSLGLSPGQFDHPQSLRQRNFAALLFTDTHCTSSKDRIHIYLEPEVQWRSMTFKGRVVGSKYPQIISYNTNC